MEAVRYYQKDIPGDWGTSMRLEGRALPKTEEEVTEQQYNEVVRMAMARLLPGEQIMDKVLRYETRLHRYLLQTLYLIMVMKGLTGTRPASFSGVRKLDIPKASRWAATPQPAGS